MGHKVNPKIFRIGITTDWKCRWFSVKDFASNLKEDFLIKQFIKKQWKSAYIAEVEIERLSGILKIIVKTSRPGVLIGRGGKGIEEIAKLIKKKFLAGKKIEPKIEVFEIKQMEESAKLLGQQVAEQIEKRIPFRRALKSAIDQAVRNKNLKGVKIEISGRLNGSEMSRREWLSKGTIPLHTLRADIDFATAEANTTYGVIGVKVWIYKGEVFK